MNNQFFINRGSDSKLLITIILIVLSMLIIFMTLGFNINKRDPSFYQEFAQNMFPEVTIRARAAYVYDLRTKTVLFAKNEDARLPLASLTKIMSAVVARDLGQLYGTVTISEEALRAEGESGLYQSEQWSLKNLLDFSLLTSSNDGMRAIALSLGALSHGNASADEIVDDFVREMNKKAGTLGLKNTYFWNETGLDLATIVLPTDKTNKAHIQEGAYGSAKDMSLLLEHVINTDPELLSATRETSSIFYSSNNNPHLAINTNGITREIPRLLASKTGFTDAAGGNLIIAFDPELGRPIVISILGSTEQGRFEDMRILMRAVMEYLNNSN